jgi:LacI family transcriptional regulator
MKIKDVAKAAGVSTATVSHVINRTRFVTEETKQKVLAAIDSCNYTPNAPARPLASGRSSTLGLIVSDIANPFFPQIIRSIQEEAIEHGYNVTLANPNYDPKRTVSCVQRLIEQRVGGVAIMTSEMDLELTRRLAARKVSVVLLDVGTVWPARKQRQLRKRPPAGRRASARARSPAHRLYQRAGASEISRAPPQGFHEGDEEVSRFAAPHTADL